MAARSGVWANALLCAMCLPFCSHAQPGVLEQVDRFVQSNLLPASEDLKKGDLESAKRRIQAALKEAGRFPAEQLAGQPGAFQALARQCMDKGLYPEAEQLLRVSASIWEQTMGGEFQPLAAVYTDLARARRLQKRFSEADGLVRRALILRKKGKPDRDTDAYPAFYEQAMLHADQGRYADAERIMSDIAVAAENLSGWDQVPNLIPIYESYAQILRRNGRTAEGARYEARAGRIRANMAAAAAQQEEFLKKYRGKQ
jgi:tetratricopeptide (TPR) repeat protein